MRLKRKPRKILRLVPNTYLPVPEVHLKAAEEIIADLRAGVLTGFLIIAVGPETAGVRDGFSGERMDTMRMLGNLAMMRRRLEDADLEME